MAVLVVLTIFSAGPAFAQTSEELSAVRKEIQAIKEGQTAIQKELQEIKDLLRARPVPPQGEPQNIVLSVDGDPFKGDRNAKLTLIDFSDYQ